MFSNHSSDYMLTFTKYNYLNIQRARRKRGNDKCEDKTTPDSTLDCHVHISIYMYMYIYYTNHYTRTCTYTIIHVHVTIIHVHVPLYTYMYMYIDNNRYKYDTCTYCYIFHARLVSFYHEYNILDILRD